MIANGREIPKSHLPASVVNANVTDPAEVWKEAAPRFGQEIVPHIFTVAGRYGVAARAYSNGDQALRHSRENAEIMRNEPAIMECLESRMRGTALLNWHIQPMYEGDHAGEELAQKMTHIVMHTPNFMKYRYSLMDAIWYGRYANVKRYGRRKINGHYRTFIKRWEPRHGDKLVFRYDDGSYQFDPDQVGIRVGPGYNTNRTFTDIGGNIRQKVEATQHGLAYWFDDKERRHLTIHKHIVEDGEFFDAIAAGNIHGVGIRSRIYWTWYAYQECLKLLLEYIERTALGIEVWRYPAHNPRAQAETESAAKNRGSSNRSIILVPVTPGENADLYGPQIIEPGIQGAGELKEIVINLFGHKMKRYIMGQILSSEAEATGLGSGVADAHLATYGDIIKFDAIGLEETMTNDDLRVLQLLNFPGSDDIWLQFKIDTNSPNQQEELEAMERAYNMGLKIKADEMYDKIGTSRPGPEDDVLDIRELQQQQQPAQGVGMSFEQPESPESEPEAPKRQQTLESLWDSYSADSEPTEAQKEAGNYKMDHTRLHGLRITIENRKGTVRKGSWGETVMQCDYGYIKGTEGRDGDHVDVFIGPHEESEMVFVIDQCDADGKFDEHKAVFGCVNTRQAKELYLSNYSKGWKCGPITAMTIDQFKTWLSEGNQRKEVHKQVSKYGTPAEKVNDSSARTIEETSEPVLSVEKHEAVCNSYTPKSDLARFVLAYMHEQNLTA